VTTHLGIPAGFPPDYYERIREVERSHWWHRGMRALEAAMLGDRLRPGLSVLDAGCGTGGFLRWALDTAEPARACGVDIGAGAIALAEERVPEAELHVRPVNDLPFEPDSFDLIVMNDVLQHVPDADVAASLGELLRVARPGAALVVRTGGARRARRERDDWRLYDRAELRRVLQEAGWRCERVSHANVVGSLVAAVRGNTPKAPDDTRHGIPAPASRVQNAIGSATLGLERAFLRSTRGELPFGHTLIALASATSGPARQTFDQQGTSS
jgi:SAM-dependent methyltransferase